MLEVGLRLGAGLGLGMRIEAPDEGVQQIAFAVLEPFDGAGERLAVLPSGLLAGHAQGSLEFGKADDSHGHPCCLT